VVVAVLGAHDALRFDLRPAGALATARRLVGSTVTALTARATGSVAVRVAALVSPKRPTAPTIRAIETALILLADHDLAASTLAARVAASFRADPYAAVSAGLGAVAGTWHGAASRRVETALAGTGRARDPERVLGELLHDGRVVPGFGHPLYPDGDPRVATILKLARATRPMPDVDAVLALAAARGLPHPNVDFALAALSRGLRLEAGASEALFAIARLAGWLAHAMEEYAEPTAIRQRAVYTGAQPE
jgi:citrate synthase